MKIDFYLHTDAPAPSLEELEVRQNGIYTPSGENIDGFSKVTVDVQETEPTTLQVEENGNYLAEIGTVWNKVDVNVNPVTQDIDVTENGTYVASDYNSYGFFIVTVDVPSVRVETLTQAEYDVLMPEDNVLYCITD